MSDYNDWSIISPFFSSFFSKIGTIFALPSFHCLTIEKFSGFIIICKYDSIVTKVTKSLGYNLLCCWISSECWLKSQVQSHIQSKSKIVILWHVPNNIWLTSYGCFGWVCHRRGKQFTHLTIFLKYEVRYQETTK